jgi:hypothetical protein
MVVFASFAHRGRGCRRVFAVNPEFDRVWHGRPQATGQVVAYHSRHDPSNVEQFVLVFDLKPGTGIHPHKVVRISDHCFSSF